MNRRTNLYTTGLAILAREGILALDDNTTDPFDITHRRIHRLARWKQTRICGHVRFVLRSGVNLDVFNTHLSLPAFLTRGFWRSNRRLGYGENQLQEAKRLMSFVHDARRNLHRLDPPHSRDYPTAGIMSLRLPIDCLFSMGRIEWLDFDETHTFGLHGGRFHGLSDHVPLVARCRIAA